jgi:hypothetical protein
MERYYYFILSTSIFASGRLQTRLKNRIIESTKRLENTSQIKDNLPDFQAKKTAGRSYFLSCPAAGFCDL